MPPGALQDDGLEAYQTKRQSRVCYRGPFPSFYSQLDTQRSS
jgi:hypothetical protein